VHLPAEKTIAWIPMKGMNLIWLLNGRTTWFQLQKVTRPNEFAQNLGIVAYPYFIAMPMGKIMINYRIWLENCCCHVFVKVYIVACGLME
jgi:hypothetical protein